MTSNIIYVLDKRVALKQPVGGFKTSIDAVLLAAACPVRSGQRVLDLGCGVGSVSLCILERAEKVQVFGIDVVSEVIDLARENAHLNDVAAQCNFECVDIRAFKGEKFDHVVCNPPFLHNGAHVPSPSSTKATAMGFLDEAMDLKIWVDCAWQCIAGQGSLTLIHRADEIDMILQCLGKRFGAIEIIPLWPKAGADAKRVIVRACKHRKSPARIAAGIVLHEDDGKYSARAEKVLRGMEKI